jgi:hypothetical protein
MLFMNAYEVDEASYQFRTHPVLGPATRFLRDFRDEVNSHSDGWAYWNPPLRAAKKLMELIQAGQANERNRYTNAPQVEITEAAFRKALAPIRAFYTRRGTKAGMAFPSIGGH